MRSVWLPVTAKRAIVGVGVAAGVAALAAAAAAAAASVIAARMVVTPPARRALDVRIVGIDSAAGEITLQATPDSELPGEYSLLFDNDRGHARIGELQRLDDDVVVRSLGAVDGGDLSTVTHGRWSGWVFRHPRELGVRWSDVAVDTALGPAPAWFMPVAEGRDNKRWAILVHGRAATRSETLRAVRPLHEAGCDVLAISYRNDPEAPRSPDHRYALGVREWRDVDAAIRFARSRGAEEIVLMGWSMGGATVLQTAALSPFRDWIRGLVLESPVVDWLTTLEFQAKSRALPQLVQQGAFAVLSEPWGRWATGLHEPVDLDRLNFVARAAELEHPTLILHSDDDGYVPSTASRALAEARPDMVRLESFTRARHVKLWNYAPERWERSIREWTRALFD